MDIFIHYFNRLKARYLYTLGKLLSQKNEFDKAIHCFRLVTQLKPNHAHAHDDLGRLLLKHNQLNDALIHLHQAVNLAPDLVSAHWNLAYALLITGDYQRGWQEYEWRWRKFAAFKRELNQPLWDGSNLTGKRILVYAEQGFGDSIQFVRYLPRVKSYGGYVIFESRPELISLLKNMTDIDELIEYGAQLPEFDVQIPLLSLPYVLQTTLETIPATIPYLTTESTRRQYWAERLQDNQNLKVGIAWAGRKTHQNNRYRSCQLEDFLPLTQLSDITFYSLQKGEQAQELKNLSQQNIIDLNPHLNDFASTAAVIANLDLVIAVDTAVTHLAGALGRPVWNLLPFAPDFRWLLNRSDTPWYPTMRLFRQEQRGEWEQVFSKVMQELHHLKLTKEKDSLLSKQLADNPLSLA